MRIVTIITAALLSFAVNAAQQATIQYCDNNREQAIQEAFSQIDYVLPDKISDYMKEHEITVITNDVIFEIHTNTYINVNVSSNFYNATSFLTAPDFSKALSGDLKTYDVTLVNEKVSMGDREIYPIIIDRSTGLHYEIMSVYDAYPSYLGWIYRYRCVENPLGTSGSSSSLHYKAGINLVLNGNATWYQITLYNDTGTSLGTSSSVTIENFENHSTPIVIGTQSFEIDRFHCTFSPDGGSVLTSNEVEEIISERIPHPAPVDRIYDSIRENRIAHYEFRQEPYSAGTHSSDEYLKYEFDIEWTNYTTSVSSGKTIRNYTCLNLRQTGGRTVQGHPSYHYNETDGVGYFNGWTNYGSLSTDTVKKPEYAPWFVFTTNINWQISADDTANQQYYYFKLLSKREDCWNQYLKGDLKIYDSQDVVIDEVLTKTNLQNCTYGVWIDNDLNIHKNGTIIGTLNYTPIP